MLSIAAPKVFSALYIGITTNTVFLSIFFSISYLV
jgi:hypothetical protein